MGLHIPVAETIVAEHSYKKIEGSVLFIGRQTVFLDEHSLMVLLKKYDISLPAEFEIEYDEETRGSATGRYISDRCFMKSLGIEEVRFLDVTDYEGADIVHDLGYPVPESMVGKFDFIYNGGCFDNMFNPGVALINISKMLRAGGRVVCFESASSFNAPYLMYSPGWFWDYFVTNGYADCKVYLGSYYEGYDYQLGPWKWYYVNPSDPGNDYQQLNGIAPAPRANNHFAVVVLAEKGPESTSEIQPIQYQYRVDAELLQIDAKKAKVILASDRPLVLGFAANNSSGYLTYLGKIGANLHRRSIGVKLGKFLQRTLRAIKNILIIIFDRSVS